MKSNDDEPLSNFAFKYNLRPYNKGLLPGLVKSAPASAITFAVYEASVKALKWTDDDAEEQ